MRRTGGDQRAREFGVHASQISMWKKQALGELKNGFGGSQKNGVDTKKVDQPYRQIGKRQVENDFLQQAVYPDAA